MDNGHDRLELFFSNVTTFIESTMMWFKGMNLTAQRNRINVLHTLSILNREFNRTSDTHRTFSIKIFVQFIEKKLNNRSRPTLLKIREKKR